MKLKFTYDEEANAAYLDLAPKDGSARLRQVWASTDDLNFDLVLDIGPDGRMLGIEIIGASDALSQGVLDIAPAILERSSSRGGAMTGSGELPDLLSQLRIYPVELVFPLRSGFTLWGGNVDGGEHDFFLTGTSGKILLADSLAELGQRTPAKGGGLLAETAGFGTIRSALSAGEKLTEDDETIDSINFKAASAALAYDGGLKTDAGGEIVACLDAARDLAKQLKDDVALDRLQNPGEPLRNLYYFLCDEDDAPDRGSTAAAFDEMVDWFLTCVE
ncbi:DUF2283 domain-containing protein [Micromonosporaceae bacterium Da 78-11]